MRSVRAVRGTIAVLCAALVAACGTSSPAGTTSSSATVGPTPSIAVTAVVTADPRVELSPLVEAVRTNLAANGLKESDHEDTGPVQLVMPCDKVLRATQVVGRLWNYTSSRVDLFVYGLAYAPDSGAKVVDEVRAALPNCAPWVWGGNWNMTFLGQFKAITPAGIDDLVAYCHQQIGIGGTNKGLKQYTCDIVIGRGHLVVIVSTLGTSNAGAQNDAKNALPKAAKALIAAVPTA